MAANRMATPPRKMSQPLLHPQEWRVAAAFCTRNVQRTTHTGGKHLDLHVCVKRCHHCISVVVAVLSLETHPYYYGEQCSVLWPLGIKWNKGGKPVDTSIHPEELLARAIKEGGEHLGQLLESYRNYLRLLASLEIGQRLQVKVDASDLVQETMLAAHKDFGTFRGTSEAELAAWLRQIMASVFCGTLRKYLGTKKRDIRLERTLQESLDRSSLLLGCGFVDPHSSPSQQASRREQSVLLANALAKLPDDYREALVLRHLQGLTFPEIGRRMGRSQDSVEKLWMRGLLRLRQIMAEP